MHRLDTRQYLRFSMDSLTTSTLNFCEIAQTSLQISVKTQTVIIFFSCWIFIKLIICIIYEANNNNDTKLGRNSYLELCETLKLEIFGKIVKLFWKNLFLYLLPFNMLLEITGINKRLVDLYIYVYLGKRVPSNHSNAVSTWLLGWYDDEDNWCKILVSNLFHSELWSQQKEISGVRSFLLWLEINEHTIKI